MRLDLRQLATFAAVAETGSLARAAERLHLSPSALSMQLRALQDRLGLVLLQRTGRGLRLTEDGERLLAEARPALEAVQRLEGTARALARPERAAPLPVSIGTILDPGFIRLGDFLHRAHGEAPALQPVLRHGTSGWVLRQVREGRLDTGFYLGECDEAVYLRRPLAPVRYVVVAPRGWAGRLAAGDDWAALARLPWIGTPADSVHHRLLAPVWEQAGARQHRVAEVDQEASMLDLVGAGVGLSLAREAPALRAAHERGLVLLRHRALDTVLSFVVLRRRQPEPALVRLVDAVDRSWGRPGLTGTDASPAPETA
jgi:DNA-binding transcriptional LysR family regulator